MIIASIMSEKTKKKPSIYKPKPISGFPEWLPEERLVEQRWFDHIRKVFESYGFCSIETPSVEETDVLLAKGEVDKEIYEIKRIHEEDSSKESRLALHFDQTVPFARYTAQHFNELVFPFKRYQIQRVWRGERPQMGRMREFYQCDIDIINVDNLPLSHDAEVAAVMYEVIAGLGIGPVQMRISNRKILMGLFENIASKSEDIPLIMRALDKIEKVGIEETKKSLREQFNFNDTQVENIIAIASRKFTTVDQIEEHIGKYNNTTDEGFRDLISVMQSLSHLPEGAVVADLSIIRGLDYYTGTVYETQLLDVPEFTGSVCSGGRYDDLAGGFINKHLPGVGISLGFSRLFDVIRQQRPELLKIGPKSPTDILLYTEDSALSSEASKTAQILRQRGINVEVFATVKKWDKHFNYAKKKLIPYIWYVSTNNKHEIKNVETGDQTNANPTTWSK